MRLHQSQINTHQDLLNKNTLTGSLESRSYTDFLFNGKDFPIYLNNVLNTSSVYNGTDLGNHPGIAVLTTGTSATGSGRVGNVSTPNISILHTIVNLETLIQLPVISTSAQEYEVNIGLMVGSKDIKFGCLFYYDAPFKGDFWKVSCRNNTAIVDENEITTTVLVSANTWYRLNICIFNSVVYFYIDGNLVGNITTNIPVATLLNPIIAIEKWVGTTARLMNVDYTDITFKYYNKR